MQVQTQYGPALAVLVSRKDHARKAVKWLRDRSYLAFYRDADKSVNLPEYPQGAEWTYEKLNEAVRATR